MAHRVVEQGRYHLDLSHPSAVKHLDEVVDFLAGDWVSGISRWTTTSVSGRGLTGHVSAGVGLLAHNRAFLDWVDGVLGRYPGLELENCASGGMRTDNALLHALSAPVDETDQQDFLRLPPGNCGGSPDRDRA